VNYSEIETSRIALQLKSDEHRTKTDRNRLGQFATPTGMAQDIVRYIQTLFDDQIDFLEPSLGTGSFYSALLSTFGRERIHSAVGVEIDDELSNHAQDLWASRGLQVINDDFFEVLRARPHELGEPNLIITNPPYSRHHHLDSRLKRSLVAEISLRTGLSVSGLSGLHVYFLLLASSLLRKGGYGVWLIPSEFMDVNYGEVVRDFITKHVSPIRIHRFDTKDLKFEDALVSSCVIIFRNTRPSGGSTVDLTVGDFRLPSYYRTIKLSELSDYPKWSLAFEKGNKKRPKPGITVGDLFEVKRGIATGANDFFILSEASVREMEIPEKLVKPILPSPRFLESEIIDPQDKRKEQHQKLFVLDCDLPEEQIRLEYPKLWSYLNSPTSLEIKKRYIVSKRRPWYKQERRDPAPFMLTYMGRGKSNPFRFIWNRSNSIASNVYLLLYPKPKLQSVLSSPDDYERLFGALKQITGHSLKSSGREYGGGLHKMEPSELSSVPAGALLRQMGITLNGAVPL
jgi:adenine-specific DNA-methyltransferase